MNRQTVRVAWYRFRVTFGRRWGSYVSLVLLIGLVAGLAMGAIAAARRTQSSFPALVASTNPSDFGAVTAVINPAIGSTVGYDPKLLRTIAHLPHVRKVGSASGLDLLPLGPGGVPSQVPGFPPTAGNGLGSDDGYGFDQDRMTVVQGHLPDPRRVDEIAVLTEVATLVHIHLGQHIRMGVYTNAQTDLPAFGTAKVAPYRTVTVTVTALVLLAQNLVADDVDNSGSLAFFTPSFTRQFLACCSNYTETGIQVAGRDNLGRVDAELQSVLPPNFPAPIVVASQVAKAERAIKPESIALGVFGLIAALAILVIAAQVIGRQTRLASDDLRTLRALGADRATTTIDGVIGTAGAVVIGAALAVVVAVGLSPLAPIGPVRPVDPTGGVSFDWTVLGLGFLVLVVVLSVLAVFFSYRAVPRADDRQRRVVRRSVAANTAASLGLPAPAVTGVRFALEPGVGRNAVPVRTAIVGAGLAVVVVVATVTFSASLNSLVSHPRLYGWNWDAILAAGGGSGNIPDPQAVRLLAADRSVRAWSGAYAYDLHIDGQVVPVLGERPGTAVQPPVLSGHGLAGPDQIVLGAITLAQLHKHVGDTVSERSATGTSTLLTIVGVDTMPTIGAGAGPHLEMGTGALLSYTFIPAAARDPFNDPTPGPEEILINFRAGVNRRSATASLNRIASQLSNQFNFGVFLGSVLRPAEIINYRSMGTTPAVLGSALAVGAVTAMGLTLVASVRRRRRDLALLKTLGSTRRQLAAVVAWQSSVAVSIGTVVGVPLGIVLGRVLWDLFATEIHAVPAPTIPTVTIVVIALGALVLANVVAAIPGRMAARTPTAVLLRAE